MIWPADDKHSHMQTSARIFFIQTPSPAFLCAKLSSERKAAVYCPQCRIEFPKGFIECSECHALLLAGTPPLPKDRVKDLVIVYETNERERLEAARELLEKAGIPFTILGQLDKPPARP